MELLSVLWGDFPHGKQVLQNTAADANLRPVHPRDLWRMLTAGKGADSTNNTD